MPYKGSHIYELRQKVGSMRLISAAVDILPVRQDGKIKCVYNKLFDSWGGIGGHVELGDSWQSAAIHELYEEAGLVATPNDLELFATLSGPDRIYYYKNGSTQSFALAFICKSWQREDFPSDAEEIGDTAWLTLTEAKSRAKEPGFLLMLDAYQEYLKTGQIQHIVQ